MLLSPFDRWKNDGNLHLLVRELALIILAFCSSLALVVFSLLSESCILSILLGTVWLAICVFMCGICCWALLTRRRGPELGALDWWYIATVPQALEKRVLAFPGFAFPGYLPQSGGEIQKEDQKTHTSFPSLRGEKLELSLAWPDTFVLILEVACHVPVFCASDKC